MRRGKIIIAVLLSILIAAMNVNINPVFAQGTTYYIDSENGNDNNSGTSESSPWLTFNNVNSRTFGPGDRIYLKRGGYWRQGLVIKGRGAPNNLIEVGAYGSGPRPVIDGQYMSDFRCLYWENAAYCKVSNLTVMNAGMGVFLFGNPASPGPITVDDIICINIRGYYKPDDRRLGYSYGVAVFGTYDHQTIIRNCDISGGGNGIIAWQSSVPVIIENNYIHDAYVPSNPKEKSIGMGGLSCHFAPFIVRNNVLSRCTYKSDTGTCGVAFLSYGEPNTQNKYYTSEMYNCIIENLEDHGSPDQCAIDFEDDFHNLNIRDCAFINNAGAAIEFLDDTKYSTGINIENCYFYKNNYTKYHGFKSEISVIETGVLDLTKNPWVKIGDPKGGRHTVTFKNIEWVPYSDDYVFLQGDTKETYFPIIGRESDLSGFTIINLQNKGVNGKLNYNNHPIVDAGSDLKGVKVKIPLQLSGEVTDDRSTPSITWEQITGPGIAQFSNIHVANPTVTLPKEGDYLFRLVASDGTYIVSSFLNVSTNEPTSSRPSYSSKPSNTTSQKAPSAESKSQGAASSVPSPSGSSMTDSESDPSAVNSGQSQTSSADSVEAGIGGSTLSIIIASVFVALILVFAVLIIIRKSRKSD